MDTFSTGLVSRNKRRYSDDGFDLDLAFINVEPQFSGRLLAMAYPASGYTGLSQSYPGKQ